MISETSNDGSNLLTTSYVYDSNGSLISENDGDVTNFAYDVWGNMVSAGTASYAYNAQGLRISKTVNGVTDSFVLVGGDVWADSESTYLRGLELISSDDYFYLYNIRGDVIQLLDYSGEVVKTYDYDAYGNELTRDLSDENPFRYCGEYYDVETGLIYLRARYYDPNVGRFTSKDIHWNPYNSIYGDNPDGKIPNNSAIIQSSNLYVYGLNNPNYYSDSSGYSATAVATEAVSDLSTLAKDLLTATGVLALLDGPLPIGEILLAIVCLGITAVAILEIIEKTLVKDHSVYVLKDDTGTVQYVGRTKDVDARRRAHQKNPYRCELELHVIASGITYHEARAVEQASMAYYHTINTADKMNNQINSIAPNYWPVYKEAAKGFSSYVWNQVSNELLYWLEN